jgi:hypothetical protein
MLYRLVRKWFQPKLYQFDHCQEQLKLIQQLSADLRSPSKGIIATSASLYNFLTQEYRPFVLTDHLLATGVELATYTPNSMNLATFLEDVQQLSEERYAAIYKSMVTHYPIANRFFLDWYDGDDEINLVMTKYMPLIIEMFLFYQEGYAEEIHDDLYQKALVRINKLERQYPGIPDFVAHKDYRALVSEILQILTALYTINLRSLGEI